MIKVGFSGPDLEWLDIGNNKSTENTNLRIETAKLTSKLEVPANAVSDTFRKLFASAVQKRSEGLNPDEVLSGLAKRSSTSAKIGLASILELAGDSLEDYWKLINNALQALTAALKSNEPANLVAALKEHFGGFDFKVFLNNIRPENSTHVKQFLGLEKSN